MALICRHNVSKLTDKSRRHIRHKFLVLNSQENSSRPRERRLREVSKSIDHQTTRARLKLPFALDRNNTVSDEETIDSCSGIARKRLGAAGQAREGHSFNLARGPEPRSDYR